jgi:hypothetical protein
VSAQLQGGGSDVKIFFYIGPNKKLKSGFSIKFWKIERHGRDVTVHFGPAKLDHIARKVITANWMRSCSWTLPSEQLAQAEVERRVNAQLAQGYHRVPRRHN